MVSKSPPEPSVLPLPTPRMPRHGGNAVRGIAEYAGDRHRDCGVDSRSRTASNDRAGSSCRGRRIIRISTLPLVRRKSMPGDLEAGLSPPCAAHRTRRSQSRIRRHAPRSRLCEEAAARRARRFQDRITVGLEQRLSVVGSNDACCGNSSRRGGTGAGRRIRTAQQEPATADHIDAGDCRSRQGTNRSMPRRPPSRADASMFESRDSSKVPEPRLNVPAS